MDNDGNTAVDRSKIRKNDRESESRPKSLTKDDTGNIIIEGATADVKSRETDACSSDSEFTEESRFHVICHMIIRAIKKFIAFLFSHIGLTCFVAAYTLLGGVIFQKLELPYEEGVRQHATTFQNSSIDKIMEFVYSHDISLVLQKRVWRDNIWKILREHESQVHMLTVDKNWDGGFGDETYQWTFANSLLYSVTVITTIGYGNIAPKTPWGQFVTIVYATIGIPITMLCLRNIGDIMAGCFRLIYRFACVNMTYQYIRIQRRRMKNRFISQLKSKTHGLKKWAKRKQSEVSHLIHTEIEKHRHSISESGRRHSHSDRSSKVGSLQTIDETAEVDNETEDAHDGGAEGGGIEDDDTELGDRKRRDSICVTGRRSSYRAARKHSLGSGKLSQAHDPPKLEDKSHKSSSSVLEVISEDEITREEDTSPPDTGHESDITSGESSLLDLQDFEEDERLLKERLKHTRNLVPISMCLMMMTGYIILGAMIFVPWEENWDFLIGFYFCFITLTTIGFGDFVPGMATSWDNDEKRVFCVAYLLLGMALLAMSFHLIQEEVKHKFKKIAIKIGLFEEKINEFLDSYEQKL